MAAGIPKFQKNIASLSGHVSQLGTPFYPMVHHHSPDSPHSNCRDLGITHGKLANEFARMQVDTTTSFPTYCVKFHHLDNPTSTHGIFEPDLHLILSRVKHLLMGLICLCGLAMARWTLVNVDMPPDKLIILSMRSWNQLVVHEVIYSVCVGACVLLFMIRLFIHQNPQENAFVVHQLQL